MAGDAAMVKHTPVIRRFNIIFFFDLVAAIFVFRPSSTFKPSSPQLTQHQKKTKSLPAVHPHCHAPGATTSLALQTERIEARLPLPSLYSADFGAVTQL